MDRRHLRAHYRRYLATYTIDSLPRPERPEAQFLSCRLEFDGQSLRPVLGQVSRPASAPTGFKRLSGTKLRDNGLVELVALLHLSRSGGFLLASSTVG